MSAPPQRIIFVNRFYWPDEPATAQLLTDLAEALVSAGQRVLVITSGPAEPTVAKNETHKGVEIVRVSGQQFGRRNALLKALDFLSFASSALREISRLLTSNDVLVVMTDPPLIGIPATWIARRRSVPVVHWIQDVYPEIATAAGGLGFARIFRSARDRAWKRGAACVALGRDMAAFLRSRGVAPERTFVCPNWAPAGLAPQQPVIPNSLRSNWGLTGKFVVMYSGNLGRVHDLEPVLSIAEAFRSEKDIVFLFVGEGAQRRRLQSIAAQRSLTNVVFQPAQPREHLGQTLALADLHLVTLRAGCEQLVFPSKLYGITAVGRPVLFIGPENCELAHIVTDQAFGGACDRTNLEPAIKIIRQLRSSPEKCAEMGRAAEMFYRSSGGLDSSIATWTSLLSRLKPLAKRTDLPPN